MSVYWTGMVEYGEDSRMFCSADTEEKAMAALAENAAYYRGIGREIRRLTLQWTCAGCDGYGFKWVPNKRNRNLGKQIKCPECLGMDSKGDVVEVTA